MKLPLSWLAEFVTLEADVDELCRRLTLAGLEVESVERAAPGFSDVFVARVLKVERHPTPTASICATSTPARSVVSAWSAARPTCEPG